MSIKENVTQLIANGYHLIPIRPNEKRPAISNWQNARLSADEILKHTAKGCGIGILTGVGEHPVCGVDIDSMDEELAQDFLQRIHGDAIPVRGSGSPKALALIETDVPYPKIVSRKFLDSEGNVHQLELLGKGQQFVAFGVHPSGNKYAWAGDASPITWDIKELHLYSLKDLNYLVSKFESLCIGRGYKAQGASPKDPSQVGLGIIEKVLDDDDPFANLKQTVGLTPDECAAILDKLSADDYDMWLKVGMALHHEFQGNAYGCNIWDDWSKTSQAYKDYADIKYRWSGFGKGSGEPVTMRSLQYHKQEIETAEMRAERVALGEGIRATVAACGDMHTLMDEVASEVGVVAGYDATLNGIAESAIKSRFKALSGGALMPVKDIREALIASRKAEGNVTKLIKPKWCEGWVHIGELNKFYDTKTGVMLKVEAFKLTHADKASDAAVWVLAENLIPKADRMVYLPGAGPLFTLNGINCVNTYSSRGVVKLSVGEGTDAGADAVKAFKRHVELMVGGGKMNREAILFCNFFRYLVENPGKRITWALLLQGGYGQGKTTPIARLMHRLLGTSNVRAIRSQTINEVKYNSWADGHQLGMIEEIKLHGHNRFDILNQLKDIITNDFIEIRKMQTDVFCVPNPGNYYITTNYKDALPIDVSDRRYMILFSTFPQGEVDSAGYFKRIYDGIREDAGAAAIGRWLVSVDYHKDFNPKGHAPYTTAKEFAADLAVDELKHEIEDALERSDSPLYGKNYVFSGPLIDYLNFESNGRGTVSTQLIARYLEELEYIFIGRIRIEGKRVRAYLQKSVAEGLSDDGRKDKCRDFYEIQRLIS